MIGLAVGALVGCDGSDEAKSVAKEKADAETEAVKEFSKALLQSSEMAKLARDGDVGELAKKAQVIVAAQKKLLEMRQKIASGDGKPIPILSVRRLRSFLPDTLPGRDTSFSVER
jgi:hypothetical protein